MEVLAGLLVAGACALIGVLAVRHRARRDRASRAAGQQGCEAGPEPEESTGPARDQLEDLHLRDVVLYDSLELLVVGVARWEERDQRWSEWRLVDGPTEWWLVLRQQDAECALLGEPIEELGLGPQPSESIEHAGQVYHLERCGQARVSVEGELGATVCEGECRYWDYRRPGSQRLWVRRGPTSTTTSCLGQRMGRHMLCVLPGS